MHQRLTKRFVLGSVVLFVVIPGGLVYRRYQQAMSLAYQQVSSGGKIIHTACGPLQYAEFGEGPPILIVHGAGGGYDQGEYFARLIGGKYHWMAPSRFGFLATPVPEGADSSKQADAYACLLDALEIDRVGVVGVSMGAQLNLTAIVPLQPGSPPPPWWVGGRLLWPFAVETSTLTKGDVLNTLTPILGITSAILFLVAAAALLRWLVPIEWFQWLVVAGAALSHCKSSGSLPGLRKFGPAPYLGGPDPK